MRSEYVAVEVCKAVAVFISRNTNLTRRIQDEYKTIYSDTQIIMKFDCCSLNLLARSLMDCVDR